MLAYIAIFSCALAGYVGLPVYAIAASSLALAALSYSEHASLYERGRELGLSGLINTVLLRSLANGLAASMVAYGGGWALKWL